MIAALNKFELGIFENVDIDDYHRDREFISSSAIKEARKSLKHFDWYLNNPGETKSHFEFGNAFELALMDSVNGTNDFDENVLIFDESKRPEPDKNFGSNKNKDWKIEQFLTTKYIIAKTGDESFDTIQIMLKACKENELIEKLLKNTNYQSSLFWEDSKTGIKLKTRPDVSKVNKSVIVDIKTTRDGSPRSFAKDVANYDYPLQAVLQMRGCVGTGMLEKVDKYYWLVAEKNPPYNVQIYNFPVSDWAFVEKDLDYVLGLIKQSRDNGKFEGYSYQSDNKFGIIDLVLPNWYKQ